MCFYFASYCVPTAQLLLLFSSKLPPSLVLVHKVLLAQKHTAADIRIQLIIAVSLIDSNKHLLHQVPMEDRAARIQRQGWGSSRRSAANHPVDFLLRSSMIDPKGWRRLGKVRCGEGRQDKGGKSWSSDDAEDAKEAQVDSAGSAMATMNRGRSPSGILSGRILSCG